MTDTDKLKRLAERGSFGCQIVHIGGDDCKAILALIAENERLRVERKEILSLVSETSMKCGEAVALLRHCYEEPMEPWHEVSAFLARIDADNNSVA